HRLALAPTTEVDQSPRRTLAPAGRIERIEPERGGQVEGDDAANPEGVDVPRKLLAYAPKHQDRLSPLSPRAVEQVWHEAADRQLLRLAQAVQHFHVEVQPGTGMHHGTEAIAAVRLKHRARPVEQPALLSARVRGEGDEVGRNRVPGGPGCRYEL